MERFDNPSCALNMLTSKDGEYIEAEPIINIINAMFDSDNGCIFYAEHEWASQYNELRRLFGRNNKFIEDE